MAQNTESSSVRTHDRAPTGNYRWASIVRLTMDDPRNNNLSEGDVIVVAGRCETGEAYCVLDEEKRGFTDVECEVLHRYHADTRMSEDDITSWAAQRSKEEDHPWRSAQ